MDIRLGERLKNLISQSNDHMDSVVNDYSKGLIPKNTMRKRNWARKFFKI